MVGLTRHKWTQDWTLASRRRVRLQPVERYGLQIASAGFILGEDQPLTLEGISAQMLVRQLINDVAWTDLDVLVIDMPPGTADVQQQLLKVTELAGAVIVVTPQYVAHLDARKAVQMHRRAGVRVLGAVENMAGLRCPHCGELVEIYPEVPAERSIWSMDVLRLGSIPMDPELALAGDTGQALTAADSDQAAAFREVATRLLATLN
jgi:ATP-binding protein involved in chromosome partitioning